MTMLSVIQAKLNVIHANISSLLGISISFAQINEVLSILALSTAVFINILVILKKLKDNKDEQG
jgi:hypothetical protein